MRAKQVLTLLLAAFVLVAVILIAKQSRVPATAVQPLPAPVIASVAATETVPVPQAAVDTVAPANGETPSEPVSAVKASSHSRPASPRAPEKDVRVEPPAPSPPPVHVRKIVATYFHGNIRCVTCRKIEAYAREAVEGGFEPAVAAGEVEFRAVNIDEEPNRHFIEDYQLVTRTLVISEEVDGAVERWARLDNVWGLVGDRTAFLKYVQGAVSEYLETN